MIKNQSRVFFVYGKQLVIDADLSSKAPPFTPVVLRNREKIMVAPREQWKGQSVATDLAVSICLAVNRGVDER